MCFFCFTNIKCMIEYLLMEEVTMFDISLVDGLHLQKLDSFNKNHMRLARTLDKDERIFGEFGYLYSIEQLFHNKEYIDRNYLLKNDIYHSPYAIYYCDTPIGFMEISNVFESLKMVDISYALLKKFRGNGYASKTLREISRIILSDKIIDIQLISLIIDITNKSSQSVAVRAGFVDDGLSSKQHEEQGYIRYQKTKTMLCSENNFN